MSLDMPLEDVGLVVLVQADAALLHDARCRRRPLDRRRLLLHRVHVDDEFRGPPDRTHDSSVWRLPAAGRCPRITGSDWRGHHLYSPPVKIDRNFWVRPSLLSLPRPVHQSTPALRQRRSTPPSPRSWFVCRSNRKALIARSLKEKHQY